MLRAPYNLSPLLWPPQRQPSKLSTPEYTVELKGALLSWAPKDKSSKKNVLEVSVCVWGGGLGEWSRNYPEPAAHQEDLKVGELKFRAQGTILTIFISQSVAPMLGCRDRASNECLWGLSCHPVSCTGGD